MVSDSQTGVRNIYLIKDGAISARTNTLTDIQFADFDPARRDLLITELTGEGRRLKSLKLEKFNPPKIERASFAPPPKSTVSKIKIEEDSYQPLSYLLPRYWIPFIFQVEEGLIFQGMTAGQDPAGRNRYSLSRAMTRLQKSPPIASVTLTHRCPPISDFPTAARWRTLAQAVLQVNSEAADLNLAYSLSRFSQVRLGGDYSTTKRGTIEYKRLGPDLRWTYSRLNNPLNERWGYHLELRHQEFLEQSDYLDYARSYAHFAVQTNTFGDQRVFLQARGALAPTNRPTPSLT